MQVIPVVDLQQGQVVRAVRGDRKAYRPIESALCGSSDPLLVAACLVAHCAAPALYVADLDALAGGECQIDMLRRVRKALPSTQLWVDAGLADRDTGDALVEAIGGRVRPVYGSESLRDRQAFEACFADAGVDADGAAPHPGNEPLLSLDRRDGQRLDAAGCWESPARWPPELIVMTLEQVGANAGPDVQTMAAVRARAAPRTVLIGAGGIRDAADLAAAERAGAGAWLVASALHDRRLPAARLV